MKLMKNQIYENLAKDQFESESFEKKCQQWYHLEVENICNVLGDSDAEWNLLFFSQMSLLLFFSFLVWPVWNKYVFV